MLEGCLVSADGAIESWAFAQYTQWSHRFDQPGSYELFIEQDPSRRIEILVR